MKKLICIIALLFIFACTPAEPVPEPLEPIEVEEVEVVEEVEEKDSLAQIEEQYVTFLEENLKLSDRARVYPHNQKALPGDELVYAVGITNTDQGAMASKLNVRFKEARDRIYNLIPADPAVMQTWITVGAEQSFTVPKVDFITTTIRVEPRAIIADNVETQKGIYVFEVLVFDERYRPGDNIVVHQRGEFIVQIL